MHVTLWDKSQFNSHSHLGILASPREDCPLQCKRVQTSWQGEVGERKEPPVPGWMITWGPLQLQAQHLAVFGGGTGSWPHGARVAGFWRNNDYVASDVAGCSHPPFTARGPVWAQIPVTLQKALTGVAH